MKMRAAVVVVAMAGLAPSPAPAPVRVSAAGPPNVVVVMVDDLDVRAFARLVSLGLLPNTKAGVINRGVTFTNAFVTNPVCCPARATFLTGQYAHNHGVLSNAPTNGGLPAFSDRSTLATWLKGAGYRTGFVGKYLNYYGISDVTGDGVVDTLDAQYVPPGWDDWQALVDPSTYLMFQYVINDNGAIVRYGETEAEYQTDVLARRAVSFIDEAEQDDARPFFLTVLPAAPHNELWPGIPADTFSDAWKWTIRPAPRHVGTVNVGVPPVPSFNEIDVSDKPSWLSARPALTSDDMWYAQRKYQDRLASMRAVDDLVGALVSALTRTGELESTVIVFTSDNGYLIGEHRLQEKLAAYEESIRIPLVIAAPGMARSRAATQLVLLNDLASTIAELAGTAPGLPQDGRSLVPLLRDPAIASWRKRFLVEHWPVPLDPPGILDIPHYVGVRTASLVYVEYDTGDRELYDLTTDPYQLTNVHGEPSRAFQAQVMAQFAAALKSCAASACGSVEFHTY